MVKAVVWKELREQGLIAILLAVLGGALIVAAAAFGDPPSGAVSPTNVIGSLGAGRLLTLMLVVTAGTVCGGALFAAEKEAGTMGFLDALPVAHAPLWCAKLLAGLALTGLTAGALTVVSAVCGLTDFGFAVRLAVYVVLAFAWGALGSTLARTTLGAVGVSVVAGTLGSFVTLFPIVLASGAPGTGLPSSNGWLLFVALMIALPLVWSVRSFTATDRARAAEAPERGPATARGARLGYRALVWLAARQARLLALVLTALALALGFALLLPDVRPVFVWPALALAAGVVCGVTTFGDEQAHGRAAFWGEQRLPIGRAWSVKVAAHLLLLLWLLFVLALPAGARAQLSNTNRYAHGQPLLSAVFQTRLFADLGPQGWKYLFVPAAYGFAAGHLCGLLFRKLVVACGVAAMLGGVGATLWGPSLLAGGLSHWQVWPPAVLALVTGRLIVRAWASDRALTRGPLRAVAGGAAACALACAVGIGYRVVELPTRDDATADVAHVDALPNYDQNVTGREFRMASERYARAAQQAALALGPGDARFRARMEERVEQALRDGWPEDAQLDEWLDRVTDEHLLAPDDTPWPVLVRGAAARAGTGPFEPPQLAGTTAATVQSLGNARRMAHAVLARGLRARAAGRHDEFAPGLAQVSALARSVRSGGGTLALSAAIEIERAAALATEKWLGACTDAPAARRVTQVLASTAHGPVDLDPFLLVDRYVARAIMSAPGQWFAAELAPPGSAPDAGAPEADLIALAWTVPWERERTRRLLGFHGEHPAGTAGRPGRRLLAHPHNPLGLADQELHLRVTQRALVLRAAVRAHQLEYGTIPTEANELVARGFLAALPLDPHTDDRPFGYRVSAGETLLSGANEERQRRNEPLMRPETYAVEPGRVILWSVGADGVDNGGRSLPGGGPRNTDIVIVLPK